MFVQNRGTYTHIYKISLLIEEHIEKYSQVTSVEVTGVWGTEVEEDLSFDPYEWVNYFKIK